MKQTIQIIILFVALGIMTSCNMKGKMEKHNKAKENSQYIMNNLNNPDIIKQFPEKYFPKDKTEPFLASLTSKCDFANKSGKFVDFFTMNINGNSQTAFIYEYFLNCDSLRFIYIYDFDTEKPELITFHIEGLEVENKMIIDQSKCLLKRTKK